MKKYKTEETALFYVGWGLIGLSIVLFLLYMLMPEPIRALMPPCLLNKITGFYCPGCGGTRAVKALLDGRILDSLVYHPLVLYSAVVGGWFLLSQTVDRVTKGRIPIGMKYRNIYLWGALAIVVVNFIWKNAVVLLGGDAFGICLKACETLVII